MAIKDRLSIIALLTVSFIPILATSIAFLYNGPYIEYTETEVEGNAKNDLKDFNLGGQLGMGLRYFITDHWNMDIDFSSRFLPFPVESDFAKTQLDLLISVGVEYTIKRKKENNKKTAP